MYEFLEKGGPLMWLLVLLSILSITIFFERLAYYHRATIRVGEFLRGLSNLIARRNFAEALHECAGTPGPVARVIHAAIIRHDAPRAELRQITQEAAQLEVPKLERSLAVLAAIAFIAPLIGLLGTVTGLMDSFSALANQNGVVTSAEVAAGIYKSLLMTAAGLTVAIPTALAYSFLSSRVNVLLHDMERGGIEIVNLITEKRPQNEAIIAFETPRSAPAAGE